MASQSQTIVDNGKSAVTPERKYGDRNQANLNACYPGSPIYKADITDLSLKQVYEQMLAGSTAQDLKSESGVIYKGGLGLGVNALNTDFSMNGVPDFTNIEKTKDGKPFCQRS